MQGPGLARKTIRENLKMPWGQFRIAPTPCAYAIQVLMIRRGLRPCRDTWRTLADELGKIARGKAYSWRHVRNAYCSKTYRVGARFTECAELLAEAKRNIPKVTLASSYHDAICATKPRICVCGVRFIPNTSNRKRCFFCSPPTGGNHAETRDPGVATTQAAL